MMTQFYIIRHAQTNFNIEHRMQGQYGGELNATGRQQAQQLAQNFPFENISAFYSSDLQRCLQTAHPLARKLGLPLQTKSALREKHFGVLQQHTHKEAQQKFPDIYQRFMQKELYYCVPEGESQATFVSRFITCLQTIAEQQPDEKVLIMTHGGVVASLLQHTLHLESGGIRHFKLINLGVNIFNYSAEAGWQLELFGLDVCE